MNSGNPKVSDIIDDCVRKILAEPHKSKKVYDRKRMKKAGIRFDDLSSLS